MVDGPLGGPVAGARVEAYTATDGRVRVAETESDASGAFLLDGVPPRIDHAWFYVRAAGYVGTEVWRDDDETRPLVVWLDPAGRVKGVVRDPEGVPVAGATVRFFARTGYTNDLDPEPVTSDRGGTFLVDGLRLDFAYSAAATAAGFAASRCLDPVVATLGRVEIVLDLVLGRPASLTVAVFDPYGRVTVESCQVMLCRGGACIDRRRTKHGEVEFAPVDPGTFKICVSHEDYPLRDVDETVAEGDTKRAEVRLSVAPPLSGVVTDDTGGPVGGATVCVTVWTAAGMHETRSTTTAADGSFRLVPPVFGGQQLVVEAPGHASRQLWVETGAIPLHVVIERLAAVRLRLRPTGREASLYLSFRWFDGGGLEVSRMQKTFDADALDVTLPAPASARTLRVQSEDYVDLDLRVHPVAGRTFDLGDVVLDGGATVRVRVVDAIGRQVAARWVMVWDADDENEIASAAAQADGTFEAHGLPSGPVVVHAGATGFVEGNTRIDPRRRTGEVAVRLLRGTYVCVRVVTSDGRAAPCDELLVLTRDRKETGLSLNERRTGVLTGRLPAGRYRLVARHDDASAEQSVSLSEDASQEVLLRLAR